jgi:hypothetical protein
MAFGMIGRCDQGGLGTLTAEVHRHLTPDRTVLVDLADAGRGDCASLAVEYQHGDVMPVDWLGGLSRETIDWLCAEGIDVLWTAETFYNDDAVLRRAHQAGIRTVVYAMPELAPWTNPAVSPRPRVVTVPTAYRHDTIPGSWVLPMPVARDRLPFRRRDKVEHLYHVTGAAMRDRNGTDLLLAALPSILEPCRLTIRTERPIVVPDCPNVDVEIITGRADRYYETVPDDVDLLVMPRRYGGLSLPVQECASLGIPSLMLSSDPYANLPFVHTLSPTKSEPARMKGGRVDVFTADPRALASAIERLIRTPDVSAKASAEADLWAAEHSWSGPLGEMWCSLLDARCGVEA